MRLLSIPTLALKPAYNVAIRWSAFILQLYGVKLAFRCNLFLIIQQLTVTNQ